MARKPVHLQSAASNKSVRDQIWSAIRNRKQFSLIDLHQDTHIHIDTIRTYLICLTNAGHITANDDRYELIRDIGIDAPRLRMDGSVVTQGASREQMWRTIKILREFTCSDLAVHASTDTVTVERVSAKEYLRYLARAGYVVEVRAGRGGIPSLYRFIKSKNTGPRAPMIQRVKHLYDPNLGQVVWPKDGEQ